VYCLEHIISDSAGNSVPQTPFVRLSMLTSYPAIPTRYYMMVFVGLTDTAAEQAAAAAAAGDNAVLASTSTVNFHSWIHSRLASYSACCVTTVDTTGACVTLYGERGL